MVKALTIRALSKPVILNQGAFISFGAARYHNISTVRGVTMIHKIKPGISNRFHNVKTF